MVKNIFHWKDSDKVYVDKIQFDKFSEISFYCNKPIDVKKNVGDQGNGICNFQQKNHKEKIMRAMLSH